jgi:hypothetical protein
MISGMERTPSGAISRSKTNIAKRAEKLRQANRESALREARVGASLQERTQLTRARIHGLTPAQASSQHAATIEGRLHLKGVITKTELLAIEHYNLVVSRYGRAIGLPKNSVNPLARYVASEPRPITAEPSGASVALAKDRFEEAAKAIAKAGPKAAWAISCVCRTGLELPDNFRPAFAAGAKALVAHFRLGTDPDRTASAA